MGKVGLTFAVLLLCGSPSTLYAQARVEAGLLFDYLSISQTNTNNFGLGGRLGYRIHRNWMMEGEVAYGYGVNFQEAYRNITNGDLNAIERTSMASPTVYLGRCSNRPTVIFVHLSLSRVGSLISGSARIHSV